MTKYAGTSPITVRHGILACLSLLTIATAVAACGSPASEVGASGASCTEAKDCSGSVCLTSKDFPGGYCSQGCKKGDPSSCPSGSVCIDDASGAPKGVEAVCYKTCDRDADCGRTGYGCREKADKKVCRDAR